MTAAGLSGRTAAIVGLGLMGGSLALALRGRCRRLLAVDPDEATRTLARERRIVDAIAARPEEILHEADLVILAAPVLASIDLLERLPELHPGGAVVMDLCSTKTAVSAACKRLPGRFDPLPAHPMCGKETAGLAGADPGLFAGAVLVFTPLERTSPVALDLGEELAAAIGARPLHLDAAVHDAWVARTSHLPYLLSAALAAVTPPEAAPLIGPGFRSTARLAGSDPEMMADILATNRDEVREALRELDSQLKGLAELLINAEPEEIRRVLEAAQLRFRELLADSR